MTVHLYFSSSSLYLFVNFSEYFIREVTWIPKRQTKQENIINAMDVFRSGSNCLRGPIKIILCTMIGCIVLLSTKVSSFTSNNAGYIIKQSVFRSQFRTYAEKARVVFLGTPDVAASSLSRLIEKSKEDSSG